MHIILHVWIVIDQEKLSITCMHAGALAFLIVWFAFLWLWSMPIILIEYGVGRFTKKSTVESYKKLIGPAYRFMGGFQATVAFALGSVNY